MRKYKLFIGYRLLGEFSGIWEAKNFAAESGMSGIFSLVGENYRDQLVRTQKTGQEWKQRLKTSRERK